MKQVKQVKQVKQTALPTLPSSSNRLLYVDLQRNKGHSQPWARRLVATLADNKRQIAKVLLLAACALYFAASFAFILTQVIDK